MALGKGGKIVVGAALAAAAGYAAGILTAPKAGKETRKDIKKATEKGMAEAKKRGEQIQVELADLTARAKTDLSHMTGRAKEELSKAVDIATHAKDKVAGVAKNGTASDKDFDKALTEAKLALDHLKSFLTK